MRISSAGKLFRSLLDCIMLTFREQMEYTGFSDRVLRDLLGRCKKRVLIIWVPVEV